MVLRKTLNFSFGFSAGKAGELLPFKVDGAVCRAARSLVNHMAAEEFMHTSLSQCIMHECVFVRI